MTVTVKLFAILRDRAGTAETSVDVPPGTTVERALVDVANQLPAIKELLSAGRIAYAVNRSYVKNDVVLNDGDELALIPPVSGGTQDTARHEHKSVESGSSSDNPLPVLPIVLDYAKPGDSAFPDIIEGADLKILQGKPPRHISGFFRRREDALAYYALALPRLCDVVLGTDVCHACGKSDRATRMVSVLWRTQIAPRSFQFSLKGRIDHRVTTHHRLCDACAGRMNVRIEVMRWVRLICEHYGSAFVLLFIGGVLLQSRMVGLRAPDTLGPMLGLMILASPLVLLFGRLSVWKSAPSRMRRLVHRSVACLGMKYA